MLALLLYQIIMRARKQRKISNKSETKTFVAWPGLDSEFYQLEKKLIARGLPRNPGETLTAWLQRAARDPKLAELLDSIRELLRLHYRYRFDPQGLNKSERELLRNSVSAITNLKRTA